MRKGEWPTATAEDVLQGLDWTLRQRQGDRQRPKDICEVSCLDFAGEVYRYAFGIRQDAIPRGLVDEVESLRKHIQSADHLLVLINLRDVIAHGDSDPRVGESKWITNEILSYALDGTDGRNAPRAAIVLSQADSYADTIRSCNGPRGVLARYLPHVANNYDWLDILAVSAVDKTVLDDNGNAVPAPDFQPIQLRQIMEWVHDGLEIRVPQHTPQQRQIHADRTPRQHPRQQRQPAQAAPSGLWQYLSMRGRKNRAQYWRFYGFVFAAGFVVGLISGGDDTVIGLFTIAMAWPGLSNIVRRLHDFNRSGWWWWLCCIPTVGWLCALAIGFIKGSDGYNDYGPEP